MKLAPHQIKLYDDIIYNIINILYLSKEEAKTYASTIIQEIRIIYPNVSFDEGLILAKKRFLYKHKSFIIEI
jgi:hypothetical protein